MSTMTAQRVHTPMILDIKGNALDDGPGIRSVVFFKGCPLSCVWCHNPESRRRTPELSFDASACIGCTKCIEACPHDALSHDTPGFVSRSRCDLCFACVDVCPASALTRVGAPSTVEDVLATVLRDKPFYDTSGGGVTFSGGEATLYMEYLGELAAACKSHGIHTLLETAGQFRWDHFERDVLPHIDTIYFDLKLFDESAHREFCGVPNGRILENFARLAAMPSLDLLPRVPLIPGITASDENVLAIGDFLLDHDIRRVRLLDYNPTWVDKTTKIGDDNPYTQQDAMRTWLPRGVADNLRAKLQARGIQTS